MIKSFGVVVNLLLPIWLFSKCFYWLKQIKLRFVKLTNQPNNINSRYQIFRVRLIGSFTFEFWRRISTLITKGGSNDKYKMKHKAWEFTTWYYIENWTKSILFSIQKLSITIATFKVIRFGRGFKCQWKSNINNLYVNLIVDGVLCSDMYFRFWANSSI